MDKQTADSIITEYLQKIYGFAIKKCYSYQEAEELCAEIIKETYISLLKAEEIINIDGYIWRISQYAFSKYVSQQKKHEGISLNNIQFPYFEDFSVAEHNEEIHHLRREIAFLTAKRRQIVYRYYYQNKSIPRISSEMGLPEGTVKWHLNKARLELKEGFKMERKIGRLGLNPITALSFGHSGNPGNNGGPEFYLEDKLNLNIVYSVYHSPKNIEEIAEELGVTPVYLTDKIQFLEENGFLVKTKSDRYTTYVEFKPETYSLELYENAIKSKLKIAQILAEEYVPAVINAVKDIKEVYIPSGNYELLQSAAIFFGISNKCRIPIQRDLSRYNIRTTAGGYFIAYVEIPSEQSDKDYTPTLNPSSYFSCGNMYRESHKYPSVYGWSIDSRYSSRKGEWENTLTSDYEYLYEYITHAIKDDDASADKFSRLRQREFISADGKVNIMMVKDKSEDFFAKIPSLDEKLINSFADKALEIAMLKARNYPAQMQDLIIYEGVAGFIGRDVALMVMDILYANGTFKPLTEEEKITSNLIMFSDVLPV